MLIIADPMALCGFGSGCAIVGFQIRVGSGVFAKGSDIGADLVGEMCAPADSVTIRNTSSIPFFYLRPQQHLRNFLK